jgi:hypothetical protein
MTSSSKNVQVPQEVINSRRNLSAAFNTVGNTLVYPPDVGTHFMMFRFREYSATRNNVTANQGLRAGDTRDQYTSSIVLPVPENLSESFRASYTSDALGLAGGLVRDIGSGLSNGARSLFNGNFNTDGMLELGNFASQFSSSQAATDVAAAVARLAVRNTASRVLNYTTSSQVIGAVDQLTGSTQNPNYVTAFHGTELRMHNFSWLFSPESAQESRLLEQVSRRFKYHMLPSSTTRYFLQYPDEVDITIGGSPDYQMPFKSSVVLNVHFDYTPQGVVSKFKETGAHTQIRFGITLIETEAFVREDIIQNSALGSGTANGMPLGPR